MVFFGIPLVEWFGYLASVVVAVSLTMSSLLRLRWYNLAGAAMFSTYGFIIGALPVGFLNLFIVIADIYYLVKMYREKADFRMMNLSGADDYLAYYLDCHGDEIRRLFPRFDFGAPGRKAFYLVKNSVPIGVLLGREEAGGVFTIELDYVGPAYRDFKMGTEVYRRGGFLAQLGYSHLKALASGGAHDGYLKKMGFEPHGDMFEKHL